MRNKPVFKTGTRMLSICTLLCILTACTATTPPPPPATGTRSTIIAEGVPGMIVVETVDVSARITALDPANRKVTLLQSDGEKFTVKLGPEAVNYDQLVVGDMVKATLTEELVVFLEEEGAPEPDASAGIVSLAPKGAQPGGVVAETTRVTATITAINPVTRTATVQFEDGSLKTLPVRDDIDLNQRKLGEKVVFLVTEIIAIQVEKP